MENQFDGGIVVLTKQEFVKYMKVVSNFQNSNQEFANALDKICSNPGIVCSLGDELLTNYIELLEKLMGSEKFATISWWLYDAPENDKVIYESDEISGLIHKYDLNTVEELYDYLCHH